MREILFRGKRLDNGEWVYGAFVPDATEPTHGDLVTWSWTFQSPTEKMETIEVDRDTVGQYTGLTDKNGKKIFEGDILEENRCHFLVVFDQNWAKFKLQHDGHAIQYPEWNRGTRMEIIGNIHDNPELLESPYKEGST